MEKASGQVRMSEGSIPKRIIMFALPLFLGSLFQQLYNTVDSLILGNLVGNSALAAVASTATLIFLMVGFFEGLFLGAGVVVAKFFGAKDDEKVSLSVHTTMVFALISGAFMTVVGTLLTPYILKLMNTPEDIFDQASKYVSIYFAGSYGLIIFNACSGIMQAVGDSKHPLIYLAVSSALNVLLDILFIVLFDGGVGATALATVIAQGISAMLALFRLLRIDAVYKVSVKKLIVDKESFILIIKFGLPSGIQNSIIAIANVVVQSEINSFGTMAVAGCGAYSKAEGFAFLPVTSFTSALTTFVGQNLGAKEYGRAKKGSRFGIICSLLLAEFIGGIMFLFAPYIIKAFTQEPEAVDFGVLKMRTCTLFYFLLASTHCLAAVLRGAGKAKVPMFTMLAIWCIIRVSILLIVVPIVKNIWIVNWVYPITWGLSTIFLTAYYILTDWIHGLDLTVDKKQTI